MKNAFAITTVIITLALAFTALSLTGCDNINNLIKPALTGEIRLSNPSPKVADEITATYQLGNGSGAQTWQWFRLGTGTEDPILGATGSSYTTTDADVGKIIKVALNFFDQTGSVIATTNAVSAAVLPIAADITYEVEQIGGENEVSTSTGIKFTFSESVDSFDLTADNIEVGERAAKGTDATFTGSEKTWTLSPITVIHAGEATVQITKPGIDAGTIHVTVYKALEIAPTLTGITVTYNGAAIDPTTELDDLKADLTVTAQYSDDSEEPLSEHEYTLSVENDTLIVGNNTITVTYTHDGVTVTDEFTVTVECEHDYEGQEWEDTESATETEDGAQTRTCRICGDATETRPLYATGTEGLNFDLINNNTEYRVNRGSTAITALPTLHIPAYWRPINSTDYDDYKPVTQIGVSSTLGTAFGGSNATTGVNSTLTSVTFAENSQLTTINNLSFRYCTNLTSITLPASLTTLVGINVFQLCANLTTITVDESNPNFAGEGGILYNKDKTKIIAWPSATGSITIPAGVTSIGDSVFYERASLTEITIPEGVTEIGVAAFSNCTGLTSVTLPASVTTIGSSAFNVCSNLTSINIPEGVTEIGGSMFNMCAKLTSVNIPDGVTSIGQMAFYGCRVLTKITIPEGLTTIGMQAFVNCIGLTSITIPASVTTVNQSAFQGCTGLTSATLASIGTYMFSGCTKLATVTIYADAIAANAFYGCTGLTSVTFESTIASGSFPTTAFPSLGDLRTKFYAANTANGTPGTYIVTSGTGANKVWTLQP